MSCFEIISIIFSGIALLISIFAICYSRKHYLITIKPELWSNGIQIKQFDKQIVFDISNRGHIARLTKLKILTKNLRHTSNSFPHDLDNEQSMYLYFDYIGNNNINKDRFRIKLYYLDKGNNKHSSILESINNRVTINW